MQSTLNTQYAEFLKNLTIPKFNEMQETVIEKTASVNNLTLLAPTGSGKTLAFLIAILNKLTPGQPGVQALIIAPSRELSLQIEQVFRAMKTSYKVTCCYGGHSSRIEENSLSEAPAVVIGTPGRLADHIERKTIDASTVKIVVLDEFDKSLQMGYQDQLAVVFKALNKKQQHLLTS